MKTLLILLLATSLHGAIVVMVPNTTGVGGDLMMVTNYSVIAGNGNTLNQTVAVNTTTFWPLLGNAAVTNQTSDLTIGTRNLITLPTILTNLYFYSSASPGSGKTTTLTILTNGVSTGMTCQLTATTKATNNTSSVMVGPGIEVGVSISTASASTAVKYSWAVNLLQ